MLGKEVVFAMIQMFKQVRTLKFSSFVCFNFRQKNGLSTVWFYENLGFKNFLLALIKAIALCLIALEIRNADDE